MKKAFLVAAFAASMAAAPASAAIIIQLGGASANQGQTVQFETQQIGTTVQAKTNQSHSVVTFNNALGLVSNAAGQASVTNGDGVLVGTTTFSLAPSLVFGYAEFNLPGVPGNPPPYEATSVLVEALLNGSVVESATLSPLDGNGNNWITLTSTAGSQMNGVRITLLPSGFASSALEHVRLDSVTAPVPETGTWAMMLLGFGAVGFSIRRRRRGSAHLLQAA